MTNEEQKMLHDLHDKITKQDEGRHDTASQLQVIVAEIRELKKQGLEMNTFLMQPTAPGKISRAEAVDDLLGAMQASKFAARFVMYVAGGIVAVIGAWAALKGVLIP